MTKQPDRLPADGSATIRRLDDNRYSIVVVTDGVETSTVMSGYNAWRVFGMLAVMLEIPLPRAIGKAIKL